MPELQSFNDYIDENNLKQFRNDKLRKIGAYLGLDFKHADRKDWMIDQILASGKQVPKKFFAGEPVVPADGPPEDGRPQIREREEVSPEDVDAEKQAFVNAMKSETSFFKVRAMAKSAGADVAKTDKKEDLIAKVEAL